MSLKQKNIPKSKQTERFMLLPIMLTRNTHALEDKMIRNCFRKRRRRLAIEKGVSILYQCIVLYEDWQMQCCGEPFKIGDSVKWIVAKYDSNEMPVDVGTINFYYEAHSSDYKELFNLCGVIDEIRALYYKYEELPDSKIYIPTDGLTLIIDSADGGDEPFENLDFSAYIVRLNNVSIHPAQESEVTFM